MTDVTNHASVYLYHIFATGTLVQTIDVLGDQRKSPEQGGHPRQRMVSGIGLRVQ